jgi:hypothetical protein
VIASGAFGLGASDAAGLLDSEEHAAINPAARMAKNSFFIFINFVFINDFLFTNFPFHAFCSIRPSNSQL